MASSTLDPDNMPESDRPLGQGHGTDALGPSDITDSGSDVQPGVHAIEELDIGLDKGTNEDPDTRTLSVEGDSDATGTGERATAGRESNIEMGGDIGVDRIDYVDASEDPDLDDAGIPAPRENRDDRPRQGR